MDLRELTIKKFHEGLLAGEFSALEIAQAYFESVEEKDLEIGAYLTLFKSEAISQAEEVDTAVKQKRGIPVLAGVPLAVKDNILIEGARTTAASRILENYIASYDAAVIEKLKKAGAVFLGKTNLDEFAMGSSTENSAFKITKNPLDKERVPGGSSGGSAAAVAADLALAALGSETNGSVRQPAAFCGVVGLKPTYGAVSRRGLIAMASSLDQIGPLAKTVEDAAILFKEISGKDELDSTSADCEYGDEILNPKFENVRKLKIGVPKEYFTEGLDDEVSEAVDSVIEDLKSSKIEFKEISLPHTKYALACYYIIMPAEVSANLARYDGVRYSRIKDLGFATEDLKNIYFEQRGEGFGEEVKRRILLGVFVLSAGYYDAYYDKAQRARALIKEDFDKAFDSASGEGVDVILAPVAPTPAFKIGEKINDPLAMYMSDIFLSPSSLAGLPAISIPVKRRKKMPIGFQLIGRHFREADILGIGRFYEKLNE